MGKFDYYLKHRIAEIKQENNIVPEKKKRGRPPKTKAVEMKVPDEPEHISIIEEVPEISKRRGRPAQEEKNHGNNNGEISGTFLGEKMDIIIRKDVPMPPPRGECKSLSGQLAMEMEIGDMIETESYRLAANLMRMFRYYDRGGRIEKQKHGSYRIWREK